MNIKTDNRNNLGAAFIYFVAVLGTFLIVGFLIWATREYTRPGSIHKNRAAERMENLAAVKEAAAPLLTEYGWRDQEKGFVTIPVERAMELTIKEWADPKAARALLIQRVEEATQAPPPPPEEPSEFE